MSEQAPVAVPLRRTDDVSLYQPLTTLLRHRFLVFGLPILFAFLVGVVTFLLPRTFTASGAFLPDNDNQQSGVSGLAAQFGISVGSGGGQSPQFFADLLESPMILNPLVDSLYVTESGRPQTLAQILEVNLSDTAKARREVVRQLGKRIDTKVDLKTGVVRYAVSTRSARLSYQLANRLIAGLNEYNVQTRRLRADADRRFMEERTALTKEDLRRAENRLQEFLQRNRMLDNDPQLVFERDRLTREVRLRDQLYSTLAQSLEQAAIESNRSTPMIDPVETPEYPVNPDTRNLVLKVVLATILGLIFGIFGAFARDYVEASRAREAAQRDEFLRMRRATLVDIRHPLRAIQRVFAPTPAGFIEDRNAQG